MLSSSASMSYLRLFRMIVRSDVSVYQIFRRFRYRKNFQVTALLNRYSTFQSFFHFLLNFLFLPLCFLFLSHLFLIVFHFLYFSRFFSLVHFFFSLPFPRKLVSCFQLCAGLRQGSAKQHSFVSSTLSSVSSKLSYPELCFNFFFLYAIRRFFSSLRLLWIVAKLIRLASLSLPLNHRRATLCNIIDFN